MFTFSRRRWSLRLALWAAVCAVLMQGAVPMLASASAALQGKSLIEVCTVYGVSLVEVDDAAPGPASDHPRTHQGDDCALGSLLASSTLLPAPPPGPMLALSLGPAAKGQRGRSLPGDAQARWAALHKHGPPDRG